MISITYPDRITKAQKAEVICFTISTQLVNGIFFVRFSFLAYTISFQEKIMHHQDIMFLNSIQEMRFS